MTGQGLMRDGVLRAFGATMLAADLAKELKQRRDPRGDIEHELRSAADLLSHALTVIMELERQ
jgi:hypothetical protein